MASASLAVFFRSATIFLLFRFFVSGMISYSGSKLFSTSTPSPLEGRSLICPIEAFTMKSLPRYLLIVFALAGDSTTTRFFAITISLRPRTDEDLMAGGCFANDYLRVSRARMKITLTIPQKPKCWFLLGKYSFHRGRIYRWTDDSRTDKSRGSITRRGS